MKEWLDFHRSVGVEHFYLYNNCSSDDFQAVLAPYIKEGLVDLIDWPYESKNDPEFTLLQCNAYNDTLDRVRGIVHWLAIIDLDEFLFSTQKQDLREFLKEYQFYGGLCVNWQLYGTSGIAEIPKDKRMIECLIRKAPTDYYRNHLVKSIVQPERVADCVNIHSVAYKPPYYQVTEKHTPFSGKTTPSVSVTRIRINHYWTRDEKFLKEQKIPRHLKWNYLNIEKECKSLNCVEDTSILERLKCIKVYK